MTRDTTAYSRLSGTELFWAGSPGVGWPWPGTVGPHRGKTGPKIAFGGGGMSRKFTLIRAVWDRNAPEKGPRVYLRVSNLGHILSLRQPAAWKHERSTLGHKCRMAPKCCPIGRLFSIPELRL